MGWNPKKGLQDAFGPGKKSAWKLHPSNISSELVGWTQRRMPRSFSCQTCLNWRIDEASPSFGWLEDSTPSMVRSDMNPQMSKTQRQMLPSSGPKSHRSSSSPKLHSNFGVNPPFLWGQSHITIYHYISLTLLVESHDIVISPCDIYPLTHHLPHFHSTWVSIRKAETQSTVAAASLGCSDGHTDGAATGLQGTAASQSCRSFFFADLV